mmetsp:Transcript_16173/g.30499  ORF Transcript_16173/g.30499 Transcript_16173/m.30499 type:complete len:210 (+) Transcript_16173:337-966(+)
MSLHWNHVYFCLRRCFSQPHCQIDCLEGRVVHVSNRPFASIDYRVDQNAMMTPCFSDPSKAWYDIIYHLQCHIRHYHKKRELEHHSAPEERVHSGQGMPLPLLYYFAAHCPCLLDRSCIVTDTLNTPQISWSHDSHCCNFSRRPLPPGRLLPLPRASTANFSKSVWRRSLRVYFEGGVDFGTRTMVEGHSLFRVDDPSVDDGAASKTIL